MTPTSNPRGRARNASKTSYSRVNAIKNFHPNLHDIVKNCPALDVIFDNDNRRGSTHNRTRDKEHVARPPNAFMVYRSYVWHTKQLEDSEEKNLSCVSQLAGRSWQIMSEQARHPFKQIADIAKREHAARNPDYKYAPSSRSQTSEKKPARRASRVKVKAKVKEAATHRNTGSDSLPLSKETTPTPASTSSSSSGLSYSSSPSPSLPSTPPTTLPQEWGAFLPPPTPELRYPSDSDHPDTPPQPCVRPVTSGLIPSPSMSVLHLNDAHAPFTLDELPDKYKEAESYNDLQPHVVSNANSGQPAHAETIDYSSFISGDPEANLGLPTTDPSPIGWCFPSGPSNTTINDDFNTSSTLDWSVFDTRTFDFDGIVNEHNMYGQDDNDLFDTVITYEGY